jgi:hypothetical protein
MTCNTAHTTRIRTNAPVCQLTPLVATTGGGNHRERGCQESCQLSKGKGEMTVNHMRCLGVACRRTPAVNATRVHDGAQ